MDLAEAKFKFHEGKNSLGRRDRVAQRQRSCHSRSEISTVSRMCSSLKPAAKVRKAKEPIRKTLDLE